MTLLLTFIRLYSPLALVAFGGVPVILPEVQRAAVDVEGWVTAAQFADLYGITQAAPGPNIMIVPALGWWIGGIPGAVAALLAIIIPTSVLTYFVANVLARYETAGWRRPIELGIGPVAVGLVCASAFVVSRGADQTPIALVMTLASAIVFYRTKAHPLLLIGSGALLGAFGIF